MDTDKLNKKLHVVENAEEAFELIEDEIDDFDENEEDDDDEFLYFEISFDDFEETLKNIKA